MGLSVLQFKRGLFVNLPVAGAAGEFFWTTDTKQLYVGTGAGMVPLNIDYANVVGAPAFEELVNAQTGTTYTVLASDRHKLVTLSNAGAIAVTVPQAGTAGFESGYMADFENLGAGIVTFTPTTSTINGVATFTLHKNQGVRIISDGTDYQVIQGMKPVAFAAQANKFLTQVNEDGTFVAAQPAFTDLSGQATQAQLPNTIDLGSF